MPNKGWWALLPKVWASCLSAIILLQSIPTTYQEELAIANLKEQEGTLTFENMPNVGISRFAACYKHHVQGEEARMHRDYRKLNVDFADPHEVNAVDLVDAHISRTRCSINFFMVWSTVASSFSPRDFRSVESVFKHHPGACVVVFSSTIDGQLFTPLHRLGYQVIVVPLDVHNLLLGTKAEQWLASLHRWREQRNFHSNISNAVRKAALLRWGGVYIDFDVIVLKPITVRNAIAWMDTEVWLNGGVMAFDAGHKFLEMCLEGVMYATFQHMYILQVVSLLLYFHCKCGAHSTSVQQLHQHRSHGPLVCSTNCVLTLQNCGLISRI
jgi:hypothetical protein